MTPQNQEPNLATLLGIENMSEAEKEATLERIGGIIIEASVGNLLLSLDEEKVNKLEQYLANVTADDDIFAYLLRTYPDFQAIVEREIAGLQEEAKNFFG